MKKSEVSKEIPSSGLVKLNKKNQNVDYDYKASQQQNESPVSFYEEDFPSLSEVGLKNNPRDKIMSAHENSSSYSARLKILPQNERSKSGVLYSGQNCNLASAHSYNAIHSPSTRKKCSETNQLLKTEQLTDKSFPKNVEFSKQTSNHIQKALTPSNCAKTSKVEIEDEGEWTVVKGKSVTDRNILKDSGQVKHKKIDKNNLNAQFSFRSNNFGHRECNDQNVNTNMTEKWRNRRDNFSNKKFPNANQRTEFDIAEHPHSKFTRKKHLFVEKTQGQNKIVDSRSSQFDKGHPKSQSSLELKNKVSVHRSHCVDSFSLKDVKNFSNFIQSCEDDFSQFSASERFSNTMPQRNFNKNFVVKNEHSEVKFGTGIKTCQKSNLKQNSVHSQVDKNTQLHTKAFSDSSWANEVTQLKNHEFRNKNRSSKDSSTQNYYSSTSNDKNNISNKGNQLNKTQAKNSLVPSRKKRKSKVKRQAAMQSDKICLITPETFSKILSQKNNESIQLQNISSVNINDCDEYPELGVAMTPKCNLENSLKNVKTNLKRENSALSETFDLKSDKHSTVEDLSEEHSCLPSNIVIKVNEVNQSECEPDEEEKVPVHCNDPITISIFDMLQVNKSKKKESEKSSDTSKISPSKVNSKKLVSFENRHFVNPLGSSKPTIKRGKEREKPKPKKLSQLKKIILMDRKKRKESQIPLMKENFSSTGNDNSSKADSSFLNFNECVNNEINLEFLSHSNDLLEKNIINLEITTSEVNECLQESVNTVNDHSNDLSKEINNFSLTHMPSKVENIDVETCENSDCCHVQTSYDALKLNADMKTLDCDALKILSNYSSIDVDNIPSNLENYIVFDMVTDSLDDLHFIEKYKHLMEKYSTESNLSNIETNYSQCTDQQNIDNDDALSDIKLLFNSKNKYIFSEKKKLRRHDVEHTLFDIRYLFKYSNKEEILSGKEVISALNDIRYLFEKENCKSFHDENISQITSIPLHENFLANIKNDICSLEKDFNTNSKNLKEATKLGEDICSMDVSVCKHQNSAVHRKYSEKKILEASHALLHSKKFRSYCTHFLSKELEETVYVLLDDLARFQDRMHQKDPVKARMKRRLLYGIREIKRHMKLKKLKCIIIASDIEDSKTEGGLNDILNDLMSLAKDYQIPCVFSHQRRKLGYICHKSAPISAVGIFNYEGAEVNFKKMLEMQNECKLDYEEVVKVLSSKLTDEQIDLILKTVREGMSTLYNVVNIILKEYFPNPVLESIEEDTTDESMKNKPSVKETEFNSDNKKTKNVDETICTDKEISPTIIEEESKITIHLKDLEEASKIYNILYKYKFINY